MCTDCKHYEDWLFVIGWCNYLEVEIIAPCCDSCDNFEDKRK